MPGFFDRISAFFARHRAHCSIHETYQTDCAACRLANQGTSSTVWLEPSSSKDSSDASFEGSSPGASCADSSNTDSSPGDSSSTDSSDFGGFDGGDSGGGGASGDF